MHVGVAGSSAEVDVRTAEALIRACLAACVHYLDIAVRSTSIDWRKIPAGKPLAVVMLLPRVGWDVVPTDCLAIARRATGRPARIASHRAASCGLDVSRVCHQRWRDRRREPDGGSRRRPRADTRRSAGARRLRRRPDLCAPLSFADLETAWQSSETPKLPWFLNRHWRCVSGGRPGVPARRPVPGGSRSPACSRRCGNHRRERQRHSAGHWPSRG